MKFGMAIAASTVVLIAGCGNWVEVKPQARGVAVLDSGQTTNCRYLGKTEAAVLKEAGFLPRNPQAIDADLVNIARNDAAKMGGDAVAPLSPRQRGHQTFGIYQCGATELSSAKQPTQQSEPANSGFQTIPYKPL